MRAKARSPFTRRVPSQSKGCSASLTVVFIPAHAKLWKQQSARVKEFQGNGKGSLCEDWQQIILWKNKIITSNTSKKSQGTNYQEQLQQLQSPAPRPQASHCFGCDWVDGNQLGTQLKRHHGDETCSKDARINKNYIVQSLLLLSLRNKSRSVIQLQKMLSFSFHSMMEGRQKLNKSK